ncbi:MAG: alpha/beta hydrolase [Actinomycetota bacterium]|nr:alpha/beta hydrolase [Actinomycetota bacterium]
MEQHSTAGFRIELPEGGLDIHDLTVGEPTGSAPVVVAVHGITSNGLSWQCVADELYRRRGPGSVRFLAPDLRGRGDSRDAPGPYGLATHASDLVAISDVFGVQPLLVGHSAGAFAAALTGSLYPDRVSGLVLVDGGLAFPPPPDLDIDAALEAVIGPAMRRLTMRFAGPEAYLDFWREHPALGPALGGPQGPEIRRYLLHDLVPAPEGSSSAPDAWVSSCRIEAVRADGAGVLADEQVHGAARKAVAAGLPVELVWAARGLLDEPQGLYDERRIAGLDLPPEIRVTAVADANHYTVILNAAGVGTVVDALERQLPAAP